MESDHTMSLVHVEVLSTRGLKILRESPGQPRIAVQIMVQELDRTTGQHVYGQELWTEVRPGGAHQDYTTGEMEFRVRRPQDSKVIFAVMNLEEQKLENRFCGELRMNVGKLIPGAFAVRDVFPLDASVYFPQRMVTGDITVAIKYVPGAPSVLPLGLQARSQPLPPAPINIQQAPPPPPSGTYAMAMPAQYQQYQQPMQQPMQQQPDVSRVAPGGPRLPASDLFPAPTPIPAPTAMPPQEEAPKRAPPKPMPAAQEYIDASYQNIVPNFGEPKSLAAQEKAAMQAQAQSRHVRIQDPNSNRNAQQQQQQTNGWYDPFGWFSADNTKRV